MIITNSASRWLFITSYPTRTHAIIVIYHTVSGYEQIQVLIGCLLLLTDKIVLVS